jgi:hypothetical protein
VALLALDRLAGVEAMRIDGGPSFFSALDALAIDDARGRAGLAAEFLAALDIEGVMDAIQRPVMGPVAKVAIDRTPRWQVLGDGALLASLAQHVHQAVHQMPLVHLSPAPAVPSQRNQRRDMRPFGVGDVARVSKMSATVSRTIF